MLGKALRVELTTGAPQDERAPMATCRKILLRRTFATAASYKVEDCSKNPIHIDRYPPLIGRLSSAAFGLLLEV